MKERFEKHKEILNTFFSFKKKITLEYTTITQLILSDSSSFHFIFVSEKSRKNERQERFRKFKDEGFETRIDDDRHDRGLKHVSQWTLCSWK